MDPFPRVNGNSSSGSKIPPSGANIVLTIELDDLPRAITPQPIRATPLRRGAGWYRGDLHTHTYHSDADGSPEVLHQAAVQAGLDFLGVADHNTVTQRRYFDPASTPEMIFVRAMEVTTGEGHANVYGVDEIVDFRMNRPSDAHVLAADVRRRGGILSVNHDKPTIPWNYDFPDADCMEVWQSPWLEGNWISLARYQQRLASGRRLSAIGGSDYHQPATLRPDGPFVLARPTTVLFLDELSEAQILEAIRAGRGYITENPTGPHLSISADGAPMGSLVARPASVTAEIRGAAGDCLVWVGASGVVEEQDIGDDAWSASLSNPAAIQGFIRAEIIAKASRERLLAEFAPKRDQVATLGHSLQDLATQPIRRALSNPIYIR